MDIKAFNNVTSFTTQTGNGSVVPSNEPVTKTTSTRKQSDSDLQQNSSRSESSVVPPKQRSRDASVRVNQTSQSLPTAPKGAVTLNSELPPNEEKLENKKLFSSGLEDKNAMQKITDATEDAEEKRKKDAESQADKLDRIVGAIEHFVSRTDKRLSFEVAEDQADYIIKVYEARTGKVLRSIPAAELIDDSNISDGNAKNLFSQTI